MGNGGTVAAIVAGIVAVLVALYLYRERSQAGESAAAASTPSRALPGGETTSPAPSVIPVFLPQARPGQTDAGGADTFYALPPGMTPQDVADWYASRGRVHEAGRTINIFQTGTTATTDTPAGTSPVQETPFGGGVPLDGTTPTTPARPPPSEPASAPLDPEPTHQDIFGRTHPGPPGAAEVAAKAALGYGGGLLLESVGTAKIAADAAAGAARVGVAGPAAVGLGIGLQATQILQDTGVFDNIVKPAGAAASERLGPDKSKAVATAALPLSLPGAVIKAVVTPGESVVGNLRTAVDKSLLPEAGAAIQSAAGSARGRLTAAQRKLDALRGDVWEGVRSAARVGASLGSSAVATTAAAGATIAAAPAAITSRGRASADKLAQAGAQAVSVGQAAVGAVGQKFNEAGSAGKAVVGDLGHKFNEGAAAVGGLFAKRWF